MLESTFQASTIQMIKRLLPGAIALKNDSGYLQGVPDFTIFYGASWAWLEFKKSANASVQPNQEYYIAIAVISGDAQLLPDSSFGRYVEKVRHMEDVKEADKQDQ